MSDRVLTHSAEFGVLWMGSRNFLVVGSCVDQPIFDLLWARMVLVDSIRVAVRFGHDIPREVWWRLADYDTRIARGWNLSALRQVTP